MKRLFVSLLIGLLMGVLAACGGGAETAAPGAEATPQTAVPTAIVPLEEPTLPPPVITGSEGAAEGGESAGGDTAVSEPAPAESTEPTGPIVPWPADRFTAGVVPFFIPECAS